MKHCVNCDFHLPQHYVAACPYCGLDPNTPGDRPKHTEIAPSSRLSLEPTSEKTLSIGLKPAMAGAGSAFTDAGQFINRTPRVRSSSSSSWNTRRTKRSGGDSNALGKIFWIIAIATVAMLAFKYRNVITTLIQ